MPRVCVERLSTSHLKSYRDKDTERLLTGGHSAPLFTRCSLVSHHFTLRIGRSFMRTLSMVTPRWNSPSSELMPSIYALNYSIKILPNVLVVENLMQQKSELTPGLHASTGTRFRIRPSLLPTAPSLIRQPTQSISLQNSLA